MRISFLLLLVTVTLTIYASPIKSPSVHVLCYHTFNKKDLYSISIDELRSQIEYLKSNDYRFVTIQDVVHNRIISNKNILVTIDDGNASVYMAYKEVFKKYNIKPVLSIYPNIISKKSYALTWDQIKELSNDGCYIAAHGYFHRYVNKKLYDNERSYFDREIFYSKKVLEEKLNKYVEVFVYPFGVRSDITIEYLKKAGYKYAFTIDAGGMILPLDKNDNVYELPRYMVTKKNWKWCTALINRNSIYNKKGAIAKRSRNDDLVKKSSKGLKNKKRINKIRRVKKVVQRNYYFDDRVTNIPEVDKNDNKRKSDVFEAKTDFFSLNEKDKKKPNKFVQKKNEIVSRIKSELNKNQGRIKNEYYKLSLSSYQLYTNYISVIRFKVRNIGDKLYTLIRNKVQKYSGS